MKGCKQDCIPLEMDKAELEIMGEVVLLYYCTCVMLVF